MAVKYDKVYGESFINEKFVSHIWEGEHFAKEALRAKDGRKIEVIYQGQRNDDAGADFHSAEVKIDGQIHNGGIEIHVRSSHWRVHHHDVNPKYNDTILHVAMWDDSMNLLTRKQNGERIPTLILYDHLGSSIGKLWKMIKNGEKSPLPCRRKTETMMPEAMGEVLDHAGMDRFLDKSKVFEEALERSSEDQVLYEGVMEALGYSKNKKQFLELARKVPLENLAGRSTEEMQAILFGVAGLLPSQRARDEVPIQTEFDEETKEYVSKIETLWKLFSSQFKDVLISGKEWKFFKIRPENYPTKRIAGISSILSNYRNSNESMYPSFLAMFLLVLNRGDLAFHFHEISKISRELQDILMPRTSGYWTRHYTFGGKRHKENPLMIGRNRSSDIVINVILPVIFTHAQRLRNEELQQIARKVYAGYPKLQDNKLTRYVSDRIFCDKKESGSVIKSAIRQQGLIHIYKSFCAVQNCHKCPLAGESM